MTRTVALFICLLPIATRAQSLASTESDRAHHVVSIQVLPLLAGGVTIQGERYLKSRAWSFAISLGARSSTAADYGALRLSLGAEAKWWLWHVGPLSKSSLGALGGAFVFGRVDLAWNRLEHAGRGTIGSALLTSETLGVGYRLLPWWRLEATPFLGFELAQPNQRNWASGMRFTFALGLTLGVTL